MKMGNLSCFKGYTLVVELVKAEPIGYPTTAVLLTSAKMTTHFKMGHPKYLTCTSHLSLPAVSYISSYLGPSEPHTEW